MVKMSPKHGLNPALTTCFWCGKSTGVALCGKIGKEDREAPKRIFDGYEPCPKCRAKMELGTTIMEAESDPIFTNQPEMQRGVYPTGRWVVMRPESALRIFGMESSRAFADKEVFSWLK